jgi:type I restriction enzyme S subunit
MEVTLEKINLNQLDKSTWESFRFEEIAKRISESVNPNTTELRTYVGLEHIDQEDIHIRRFGSPDDVSGGKLKCYPGDVIFGKRRAYQRKAAIVDFEGICSAHAFVFRANPEVIEPRLFPFFLHSDLFMHRMIDISVGGLSPTINWGDLKQQEFLLPPKAEQARLVELLWKMDEAIEREREVLDRFKIVFQAYNKKYFKEDAKSFIPLSECAEVIMGQSPAGDSYNQEGNGIPLINGPTEFTDRFPVKIQWTIKPTKFCQDKDILLCVRGSTTGRINISNDRYCIGRGVAAIRGKGIFKTDFLEYALRYNVDEIMRLATGSTFPNIDSKTLKSILLPKVDILHQEVIIVKLKVVDENRMNTESKIISSKALQKSLINQIF